MKKITTMLLAALLIFSFCGTAMAIDNEVILNSDAEDVARYYELLKDIESGEAYWVTGDELKEIIATRAITKVAASDGIKRNGIKFGTAYIDIYCMAPGMIIDYWDNIRVVKAADENILECRLVSYEVAYVPSQNALQVAMEIYGRHVQGAAGTFLEVDIYDY